MDTSYLTQQVANIIGQLHGLFDDIGVPNRERDSRESEVACIVKSVSQNLTDMSAAVLSTVRNFTRSLTTSYQVC